MTVPPQYPAPATAILLALGACAGTHAEPDTAPAPEPARAPAWIPLFNGRDLDGWRVKITGHELDDNYANTFRVEDGILRVSYDGYEEFDGRFGHLVFDTPFSYYRLRVEYRFVGEQCPGGPGWAFRNSGVMLHGQSPESMTRDQEFPVSIEAQMLGGDGEHARPTANLCTPGTNVVMNGELIRRHCTNSSSETYHGDQWVTMELEVHGHVVIRHIMEGRVVLEYEEPQLDETDPDAQRLLAAGAELALSGGYLSLQSESHPVEFRKVELLPLDPVAKGPGSVTGRVALDGAAPPRKSWSLEAEMQAVAGEAEYVDETLLVDEHGGVENCVVTLHASAGSPEPEPLADALFEKVGPRYEPRVLIVTAGTTVTLRNRDSPCRGFATSTRKNHQFNRMVSAGDEFEHTFERAEPALLRCDVRPYMRGAIVCVDTPFSALTKADGTFTIEGVPPGEYRARVWHESLGYADLPEAVLVVGGGTATLDARYPGE